MTAGEEWQCVEFINRLYLTKGWISSTWGGNAGQEFWDDAPSGLSKQADGSVSYLGPGDVVDINVYYDGSPDGGHALVVNDSSDATSGSVDLVSENSGYETNSEPVVTGTLSGGSVTVGGGGGGYTYETIGVIHAPSGSSSGGGTPASGTFVSYEGNVYRIAGGAPLYVSSWSAVGGPQSTEALSTAQWDALPTVPANGTVLATGDGVFVVAGGAPLYLSNYANVPNSAADQVSVDAWDVENAGTNSASHLNAVPSNGTVLATNGDGVFVVAGGAPLYLSNYANVPNSAADQVSVDAWDVENAGTNSASHLNAVPSNGTVLATNGDGVFVVAGGAPLYLSNYANVPNSAADQVSVDAWDVENAGTNSASHLNAVPSNGTVLATNGDGVFVVAGGAPLYLSNYANVPNSAADQVSVDAWDVENAGTNSASHLNAVPSNGTVVEGSPSGTYWIFDSGVRHPTSASSTATVVDDVGLDAFAEATSTSTTTSAGGSTTTPAGGSTTTPAGGSTTAGSSSSSSPDTVSKTNSGISQASCVVPSLRHRTLAGATRVLTAEHCELGRVTRETRKHGSYVLRVVSQSAARGAKHKLRYRVNITLGWIKTIGK